jgi:1-acyl-sn-glycerol-3-phosphate acyltransferase
MSGLYLRMHPGYSYPASLILLVLRDWVLGRRRCLIHDARAAVEQLGDRLRYAGRERIPRDGPFLVTHNHYSRRGFGVWWLHLAIVAAMPRNPCSVMTSELTGWLRPWGRSISRLALPRLAKMYGIITMPPMPPRPADVQARSQSVRRVLRTIRQDPRSVIVAAPEGRDNPDGGSLSRPPPGAGRFLLLMSEQGLPLLPAAGWESGGRLVVRFGEPYTLAVPDGLNMDRKDAAAAGVVMDHLAELLPEHLRGAYSSPRAQPVLPPG